MRNETAETLEFEAVVRLYRPRIFRFALASLRDRDAAETVTQDCFVNAHRAWSGFRGEATLQTWLMQIAVNLVRDVGRSRRFQFWKRAASGSVDAGEAADWLPDHGLSPEPTSRCPAACGSRLERARRSLGAAADGVPAAFHGRHERG